MAAHKFIIAMGLCLTAIIHPSDPAMWVALATNLYWVSLDRVR